MMSAERSDSPMMSLHDDGTALTAACEATELFRYVYRPPDPTRESPRPYFHPVRTLGGDVITIYRPHDHVWHKGIALSLPHVGHENFWGGPTFRDGSYVQLANNGTMRHDDFDQALAKDGLVHVGERLTWITEAGEAKVSERRGITATAWPAHHAWGLAFETQMTNVTAADIVFASPTTEGRPGAGYGGLFWRGPRSFTGGRVILPDATGGDELMGRRAPWLALAGQHDEHGRWSTIVFGDDERNFSYPTPWFVRSTPFAGACPAPFFDATRTLPPGATLTLRWSLAIADGEQDPAACARLAALTREVQP